MTKSRKPFRDGRIHVVREMCSTCIFRPGNLMDLEPGRFDQMVRDASKAESAIICHSTLDKKQAVCYGFFKQHPTQPLQIADRAQLITFVEPENIYEQS